MAVGTWLCEIDREKAHTDSTPDGIREGSDLDLRETKVLVDFDRP